MHVAKVRNFIRRMIIVVCEQSTAIVSILQLLSFVTITNPPCLRPVNLVVVLARVEVVGHHLQTSFERGSDCWREWLFSLHFQLNPQQGRCIARLLECSHYP